MKLPGFVKRIKFDRRNARPDLMAGVVLGVESVPDALASGVLAGVNPLFALYAVMLATPIGAIFASSAFLSVQTTSAMSLVVASTPALAGGNPVGVLFTLSLFTGIIMLVAGFLKLGRLMRFVSHSEMVGFMNGVAILIILGQLGDFTGYASQYSNKVARAIDLLLHIGHVNLPTRGGGGDYRHPHHRAREDPPQGTRTCGGHHLGVDAPVSLQLAVCGQRYRTSPTITKGLPGFALPDFSRWLELIVPALSLAVIGLIQGAGVSQSFVNPDGRYPDASRDFVGQGAANVAVSFFQGMPVGGSASATSLVVNSGARTRLANIFAGVVIAIVTLLFTGAVGKLAIPALAGLLIVIGFRILKPAQVLSVWRTGNVQRVTMVITFALVLTIPLQYAVLAGVGLSILLYTVRQSNRVTVKEWKLKEGKLPLEQEPPSVVPPEQVIVLTPYGSLFYAAASVFEGKLPAVDEQTSHAVVIVNLRGRTELGSTFMGMINRYAGDLKTHHSRLMLAEVDQSVREQMARAGIVDSVSRHSIFVQTDRVGESLYDANAAAEEWISQQTLTTGETPPEGL